MRDRGQRYRVLESVDVPGRGVYELRQVATEGGAAQDRQDQLPLVLFHHVDRRAVRVNARVRATLLGALVTAFVLGVATFFLLPVDYSSDGLMPGRVDGVLVLVPCCFVPMGALLGFALSGWRLPTSRVLASIGATAVVDGRDVGELSSVDSDLASGALLFVAERGTARIDVGDAPAAVKLAASLSSLLHPHEPPRA